MASNQDDPKPEENEAAEATELPEGDAAETPEVGAEAEASSEAEDEGDAPTDEAAAAEAEADEEANAGDEAEADAGDDADASGPAASAESSTPAKKTGGKSRSAGTLTAGQRLAAAKAAKAAKKAATKGKDAQELEETAIQRANEASDWLRENQKKIGLALLGALLIGVVVTGWGMYAGSRAEDASALLWASVETARTPVVPAGLGSDDEGSYESMNARAEATVSGAREVAGRYPNTLAAVWARLVEGASLLETGDHEGARTAYESALASAEGTDDTRARAIEGIAFSYEGQERYDDALSQLESLKSLADGAFEPTAAYHVARIKLIRGDEEAAIEELRDVVAGFAEEDAERLPYIQSEAEARLVVLDPAFAPSAPAMPIPRPAGAEAGYPSLDIPEGGMSQEQLQELIRQLQAQQEAAGAE